MTRPSQPAVGENFRWMPPERLPETGEAMIHAAMARIMLRRIAA